MYGKELKVYPNPVARGSALQIELNHIAPAKYTVNLISLSGMQLSQSVLIHSGNKSLHTLKLPEGIAPGVYITEIYGGDKKAMMKVVVQ
jgi:hypothetical protein